MRGGLVGGGPKADRPYAPFVQFTSLHAAGSGNPPYGLRPPALGKVTVPIYLFIFLEYIPLGGMLVLTEDHDAEGQSQPK